MYSTFQDAVLSEEFLIMKEHDSPDLPSRY